MQNKSDFLEALQMLVERSEIDESEKVRLLDLLTVEKFSNAELSDLERIAEVVEEQKSQLELEVAESGDSDMINEMIDTIEALENPREELPDEISKSNSDNQDASVGMKSSGLWLLDKFSGLTT